MNAKEFAKRTGYTRSHIQHACITGSLPAEKVGRRYNISPRYVPVWRAKKNIPKKRKSRGINKDCREYQNTLDIYNAENGTDYSYGEAVAKGVLCDE